MIDYDDTLGIKTYLREQYEAWKNQGKCLAKHDSDAHMAYSRKRLTGSLAEILNSLNRG
jgi:hypothetical protein